jgi:hypothetical protein
MVGFMYRPEDNEHYVAFTVHRMQSLNVGEDPIDVTFQKVRVNAGDAWDENSNRVVSPESGYYYFQVDMAAQRHATYGQVSVDLIHVVDGVENVVGGVRRTSNTHNDNDGLSKGFILHVEEGEEVFLRANPYSGLFSDLDGQCVFTGFLIYQDEDLSE